MVLTRAMWSKPFEPCFTPCNQRAPAAPCQQDKAQAAAAQQQALATTKASLQQQIAEQAAAAKAAEEARGTLARLRQALGSAQARNAERGRRLASLQQQQEELQVGWVSALDSSVAGWQHMSADLWPAAVKAGPCPVG